MHKLNLKEDATSKIYEKSSYTWVLCKFSDICDKYNNGKFLRSPKFPKTESESKWEIQMYPNGDIEGENGIMLMVAHCNNFTVSAKYLFRLQTSEDEVIFEMNNESTFSGRVKWGLRPSITADEVKSKLKSDILKIHIIIWTELMTLKPHHRINILSEKKSLIKLKSDFQTMFENEEFTDFVIKLNDFSEIPVHKNILASRSPVFSAMLKNQTFENKVGHVEISDIDKDTMMLLLNFMYTGSLCSDIPEKAIIKLLPAADKYELLDLKEICVENLTDNLKVSNVIDILLLAEKYNALELKNSAFAYIFQNAKCFSDKIMLQKLENNFPNLLTELLVQIMNIVEFENE